MARMTRLWFPTFLLCCLLALPAQVAWAASCPGGCDSRSTCVTSISPTTAYLSSKAGTYTVNVKVINLMCSWSVSDTEGWITHESCP